MNWGAGFAVFKENSEEEVRQISGLFACPDAYTECRLALKLRTYPITCWKFPSQPPKRYPSGWVHCVPLCRPGVACKRNLEAFNCMHASLFNQHHHFCTAAVALPRCKDSSSLLLELGAHTFRGLQLGIWEANWYGLFVYEYVTSSFRKIMALVSFLMHHFQNWSSSCSASGSDDCVSEQYARRSTLVSKWPHSK